MMTLRSINKVWEYTAIGLLVLLHPPLLHAETDEVSISELATSASEAMNAQEYDRALELYQQLHELLPGVAEIPFNQAVVEYRQGNSMPMKFCLK